MRCVFYVSSAFYVALVTAAFGAVLQRGIPLPPSVSEPFWCYCLAAAGACFLAQAAFCFFRYKRLPFVDRGILSLMPVLPVFFGFLYFF